MKRIMQLLLIGLVTISMMPFSKGYTYEEDVFAINSLYTAFGSPPLSGWSAFGGDPCGGGWQGVKCVNSNITGIVLNGANLGGQLGDHLANFTSIITIDLSNNNISGNIPENLPRTVQQFLLAYNQLTGSIPMSISNLGLLTTMSLNNNVLKGQIPDSFQQLGWLTNLDLSHNNLSGDLPTSMTSLSSLTILHIHNNQLSGTLDVLKDLPLTDLNVEDNLFSGPVPAKLLNIPNFKKDGNPFNTTVAPSSSPPGKSSGAQRNSTGPSLKNESGEHSKKSTAKIILIVVAAVGSLIFILILTVVVLICRSSKPREGLPDHATVSKMEDMGTYYKPGQANENANDLTQSNNDASDHRIVKVPGLASEDPAKHVIPENPAKQLPPPPVDKVVVTPEPQETERKIPSPDGGKHPEAPPTAVSFSVASLQQYTNSFCEDNVIREGRLGKVYQADLPDGKQLMVMKLDNEESELPAENFLELILSISELRHPNIVELVGYCVGYGQRLLVYNHLCRRSLFDVLHGVDDFGRKLSWNARIRIALGAAKALEYLHEGCDLPVMHQNFESANVLLDDELRVHVCDSGLASIPSPASLSRLGDRMETVLAYEAPEISASGKHTDHSDVFSFGVVMLELLTGRAPYDGSRPRQEQSLVRWASSQLYDIDSLLRMVDPAIKGKYELKSVSRFADIVNRCIQWEPEFRPPMSEVVQDLMRMLVENRS